MGCQTGGQLTNLVANEEILIFSFISPSGTCVNGLRLFVNGSDPDSSQPGMAGGDFNNSIDNGNFNDIYNANYNNSGYNLYTYQTKLLTLTELDIIAYPNPVCQ